MHWEEDKSEEDTIEVALRVHLDRKNYEYIADMTSEDKSWFINYLITRYRRHAWGTF